MSAVVKQKTWEQLKQFVPLDGLAEKNFKKVAAATQIDQLQAGEKLFEQGDTDNQYVL
ncbi:MAG: hypothetical protein KZQ58_06325 [gamma proteobacterium symbiont of Bathyaustriella thionipta]|nr:hypothetical protein [gamma proteobacterium symbiont of Bathyaustriella thionipta]